MSRYKIVLTPKGSMFSALEESLAHDRAKELMARCEELAAYLKYADIELIDESEEDEE